MPSPDLAERLAIGRQPEWSLTDDVSSRRTLYLNNGLSSACGVLPFADGAGAAEAICLTGLLHSGRAGLRGGHGTLDWTSQTAQGQGYLPHAETPEWAPEAGI